MGEGQLLTLPLMAKGLGIFRQYEHCPGHTVLYLIHYDTLLQNATEIVVKCDSYFITKCDKILLQNATVITKSDVYYKL